MYFSILITPFKALHSHCLNQLSASLQLISHLKRIKTTRTHHSCLKLSHSFRTVKVSANKHKLNIQNKTHTNNRQQYALFSAVQNSMQFMLHGSCLH